MANHQQQILYCLPPISQTREDPSTHSIYSSSTLQQLPQPPQYGYDISGPHASPRSQFRPRHSRNDSHLQPHFPALASLLVDNNSSVTATSILLDPSLHQSHGSIFESTMTHNTLPKNPLPEKHHHTLPHSGDSDNLDDPLARQARPPNLVGHVGMPSPAPRPKAPKTRFTAAEDALLVHLKEDKNLTWLQIQDFFPGRTHNTLQVRYCQRLKTKDVSWTEEKVQRLKRAMAQYEQDRWRIISSKVGKGFGPEACRERAAEFGGSPTPRAPGGSGFFANFNPQTRLTLPNLLSLHPQTTIILGTMFLQRTASAFARRTPARAIAVARPFSSSVVRST
ncbi:MYB DNA-binding domain protein [Penicillium citrinum]|uniref:MYB DNA-binding domain protein n=1 Tax=Penicillium citrinum TaxID=5077 RepID=A0A9W9P6C7_PENCI|nr:MYB DNA-binding domain protein [Penicillium citrinum]KAJ5234882.1 MYB DNA-binding domain protein [Penicillium citrinum]